MYVIYDPEQAMFLNDPNDPDNRWTPDGTEALPITLTREYAEDLLEAMMMGFRGDIEFSEELSRSRVEEVE